MEFPIQPGGDLLQTLVALVMAILLAFEGHQRRKMPKVMSCPFADDETKRAIKDTCATAEDNNKCITELLRIHNGDLEHDIQDIKTGVSILVDRKP